MRCLIADFLDPRVPSRIWHRVTPEPNSGCWLWVGAEDARGYGFLWDTAIAGRRRSILAHRYFFTALHGPVPDRLELDHLCRTHACVNPVHIEAVPHIVNCRRGVVGINSRSKTHCPSGHLYDQDNTYILKRTGERRCIACSRERSRAYQIRKRSEKGGQ